MQHKPLMESTQGHSVLSEDYGKPPIKMLSSHAASVGLKNSGRGALVYWKERGEDITLM